MISNSAVTALLGESKVCVYVKLYVELYPRDHGILLRVWLMVDMHRE